MLINPARNRFGKLLGIKTQRRAKRRSRRRRDRQLVFMLIRIIDGFLEELLALFECPLL
jgi:hypothetical protein